MTYAAASRISSTCSGLVILRGFVCSQLSCIEGAGHLLPQTHAVQVNENVVRHVLAQARPEAS